MTESLDRQLSMAAREAQTPEGARELAAAEVMVKASTLLWKAFEQSGMTQRELAEALEVTEGRVSQVLHGDGNIRLSTLARYLRVTGYLAKLEAVPADSSVMPLRKRLPRRSGTTRRAQMHDVYLTEIQHAGETSFKVTAVLHGVPVDSPETSGTHRVGESSTRMVWSPPRPREVEAG